MLALLTIGMMNLVAMAAVTLAISAERLTPVPLRVARVAGAAMVVISVLTIVRV
jgi:predicted metal-binding membrane protein